ncbi:hypothetical protein GSI_04794 [Ganoderma sinense ZZ0214-1]|uniref:BTB domain-containing protein n=1 Tax=Ganoderma sinense ZZ0214-1 TaxID=1077348 RepID=A0A2G8SHV3_9APHY|nr:hypothetical protein GSI_04794 [Ganoderma sinense ZZ0214-1]
MASSSTPKSGPTSPKSSPRSKLNSTPKHDWVPDPEFYYELHTFQVDSVRFRIPTQHLAESPFFQRLFHAAAPSGPVETFCDVDHLEGVSATEFRDFLHVLLPSVPYRSDRTLAPQPSSWVNVLNLATRWEFSDLHETAIARVADIDDCVVRLAAARKYGAHRLLPKALEDALEREASLTVEEYGTLGLELAAGVVRYREAVYTRLGEVVGKDKRESLIEEIFGDGFARDWREGLGTGSDEAD